MDTKVLVAATLSTALLALAPSQAHAAEPDAPVVTRADVDKPATPKDGVGMIVGGALSLGFAGGLTALEINNAALGGDWVGGTILAGGTAITGAVLLGFGIKRNRDYRRLLAQSDMQPPRQGHGLVTGGAMSLGAGTVLTVAGGIGLAMLPGIDQTAVHPGAEQRAWTVIGLGIGSVATGATLLGVGVHRNKQWRSWRPERAARLQLTPSFGASRQGAMFGVSGRF
ncbi:MAG: hypothetical protein KC457_09900 [Myxococcales bacterium]|nr:hypothetical protein [Myxococcales bacterium]